jgi:large subunit ribosomal protein L18
MYNQLLQRNCRRQKRMWRVRKHVRGDSLIPRLSVHKSNQHLYAQLIDDEKGLTIAGIGTMSKELQKGKKTVKRSKEGAKLIGAEIAKLAKEKNIEKVVFDRGRYKFHGVIAELAAGAREAGLKF